MSDCPYTKAEIKSIMRGFADEAIDIVISMYKDYEPSISIKDLSTKKIHWDELHKTTAVKGIADYWIVMVLSVLKYNYEELPLLMNDPSTIVKRTVKFRLTKGF